MPEGQRIQTPVLRLLKPLALGKRIWLALILFPTIFGSGCDSIGPSLPRRWETYRNQRFGFEFLYPSDWISAPTPSNRDGQAFTDPRQSSVEIRGSAGYDTSQRADDRRPFPKTSTPKVSKQNFTTEQGLTGELQIEVGAESSYMTLSLRRGEVTYKWRGKAPSRQFADYYRFFYYIARRYRLPERATALPQGRDTAPK